MELAAAAVRCLLPKLASLLKDEYNLQKGVRGEIRFLTEELKRMQAALDDLSKQPADSVSHVQKEWARDLKELSYDIEDSVDAFMLRVDDAHPNPRNLTGFRKFIDKMGQIGNVMSVKEAMVRRRIAKEVEDIKTRVRVVADRKDRLTIPGATTQPDTKPIVDPRIHALFADVHSLVGIDGPAERLASLLTTHTEGQNQNLVVASIVGLGGLGKTTLAKAVYERLGSQFQCKAFVPVSLRPDLKRILMGILRQVGGTNDRTNDGEKYEHELIDDIKKYLSDKRYFIVIDDLWDEETWEYITHALVDNNCGSRVIVTTRNFKVARSCATPAAGATFELEPLSEADSKRLLYKRVFDKDGGNHTELDEVARKILKKCGGVPLAIITTASLLACKPRTNSEWYRVYRSLGPGLDKGKTMKNMRDILSLSYQELPSYLRPCLLYLSLFPEDWIIEKDRLVKLWVAEGLVVVDAQGGGNLYELYDRAEGYFNELVNRSFIRPLAIDDVDGVPNACSVHDVILDLLVSMSDEDNFGLRLGYQKVTPSTRRIHRLSLQDNEVEVSVPETVDLSHVRSVIAFGHASKWVPPLSRFKFLRVLNLYLEGFLEINDHLKQLRRLHHLRYLQLCGYLERQVLEEIRNLQHLKMLDLSRAFVSQLPSSIIRLKNLQSLLVPFGTEMPQGIGSLSKLEEMEWFVVESNTAAELGKLTELRVLRVVVVDQTTYQAFLQSLSNLSNLLDLTVRCSTFVLPDPRRALARLRFFHGDLATFQRMPRCFSWLSELSVLTITVYNLTQDDLNMLGALTVLRCLELQVRVKGTIAQERLLIGSDQPFQSLQAFKFKHHTRCWLVLSQGVMAKLEKLQLYFQVSKRDDGVIDVGLENLTSLKYVIILVNCYQANIRQVEDVETKLRDAFDAHPKKPVLNMHRLNESGMEQGLLLGVIKDNDDSDASI